MAGYVRQSAADIVTGADILAAPLNNEFNQLQSAFHATTGHPHDGAAGNGPKINLTTSLTGVLPVAHGGVAAIHKINATTAPTAGDDTGDGYGPGSYWIDVTNDIVYICVDASSGAAIWTRVGAYDAELAAIAGLTSAADKLPYFTGSGTAALADFTSYARTLVANANASDTRDDLGLTIGTNVQAYDSGLAALASFNTNGILVQTANNTFAGRTLTGTANEVTVTNGDGVSGDPTVSIPTAVTFTGKTITGGTFSAPTISGAYTISGGTDIAVADGGTGASDASGARTNLGLVIGTNVQAYDAGLAALASFNTNGILVQTADNTFAGRTLTGTSNEITVTNGDGVSGNPTASLPSSLTFTGKTVTGGTFNSAILSDTPQKVNILSPHENLKILWVSNSTFIATADALILYDSNNVPKRFTTFSTTVDITASGAAGLDTGAEASNTWYYIHAIGQTGGTKSILISTSATTPTLPSGYTFWGLIGAVRNDGSSNFIRFAQQDRHVDAAATIVILGGTATSYTAASLTAVIPVYAKRIKVDIVAISSSGTNTVSAFVASRGSGTTSTYGGEITQSGSLNTNGMRNSGTIVHYGGHECYYYVSGTNAAANLWITGYEW